ncbi:MAG: hypothetical protein JNM27_03295 [Leptospirales bacterium]|nr:hypothetical protein [Leptospirales bacterium]
MATPSEQHKEQARIDQAIAAEIIELTPEFWTAATLIVRKDIKPDGMNGIAHHIFSPQGHREIIQPDEVLFGLIGELFELFSKHGADLRCATYNVSEEPDGQWRMTAEYGYDDAAVRKQAWPEGV